MSGIERRLRLAAVLLIAGLFVEGVTLESSHPTAFLAFAFFGVSMVVLGIAVAAYAMVRASSDPNLRRAMESRDSISAPR